MQDGGELTEKDTEDHAHVVRVTQDIPCYKGIALGTP